jgi:PAS domain S-box-containing protein
MKSFLGEEDQRFRTLIENITDVIALLSVDGTFLYSSPSAVNTLGYTPDELVGKNAFGLIHPADLPRATIFFSQALSNPGKNFSTQLRLCHKDGKWRWLEGVVVNLLNDPGIGGVVVNYRDITSRKSDEEKAQQRAEQMTVLYKTTQDLVMERDSDKLLQTIVERAVSLMDGDSGALYLCEPEHSQVRCVISYRTSRDYTGTVLKYGEGAAGIVAKTGEPLIIDDYRVWAGRARVYENEESFTAILSVPMKYQDELMGVLHVFDNHERRKFNETDLKTAAMFANQAAIAVTNTRLIEQAQNHAVELEQRTTELSRSNSLLASLHSIATGLMVSQGSKEILDILSAELRRLGIGYEITLYDPATDELVVQFLSAGASLLKIIEKLAKVEIKGFRIPASAPFIAELLENGKARYVENPLEVTLSLPIGIPKPIIEQTFRLVLGSQPRPAIYLPLKVGERKIGLMAVWGEDLKPEDIDIFIAFVAQIAVALDNSRLLDSEHQHALELAHSNSLLAALHSVAAGLTISRGSDETLDILSSELNRLGIGHGITLYDPETDELISQYVSLDMMLLKRLEKLLGPRVQEIHVGRRTSAKTPFIAELLETGSARYMDDLLSVLTALQVPPSMPKRILPQAMKLVLGTSSIPVIFLPLKVRDRKIGLMAVWGHDLKPDDVDIFIVFVAQIAIALDNSRLMDLERQRAVELEYKVAERTHQLESLLQEKEMLLREVYHRVKNNLQVVNSLLNLQTPRLETQPDRQIVVDIRERVRAMALIHEKLYQSGDLARVDFSEYVQSLAGSLARIYTYDGNEVAIKIHVGKIWLGLDTAVPCGLIVNELIANSFKHAFPIPGSGRKPEIVVEMHMDANGRYILTISDNGVGIPKDLDWRNAQTMGLQLVTMLIEQLNGEISVTHHDAGTMFTISFLELKYKERR